jgi:hypothetical protein
MIKFPHSMEEDVSELNAFAERVRIQERERIVDVILASEFGDYDAGYLISLIRGEK